MEVSHVQAIHGQRFLSDGRQVSKPKSRFSLAMGTCLLRTSFSSHVFHQIVAFSTKLSHIKNCPGWKRDFDFIENTLTGSQVVTEKPESLSRSSLITTSCFISGYPTCDSDTGHKEGSCGKLTTVTTDVMQVMHLTLTRQARAHHARARQSGPRKLRKGEHEIKREEPFPRSRAHIFICLTPYYLEPGTGSSLTHLFVFFSFFIFPTTFPSSS